MTTKRRINLKRVLEQAVSSLYGDLVTRPTGKAVRSEVVHMLADAEGETTVVIDFGLVGILDISCADEIVGKLLIDHGTARYYMLYGVSDAHCDSIEQVLERHRLAVVASDRDGRIQVLGPIADTARTAFRAIFDAGPTDPSELASQLSWTVDAARQALDELSTQRLVQVSADRYVAIKA